MNVLGHEEAYRGKDIVAKMSRTPITVCGAGTIGSNLIENMARQGFANIKVIDFDRVEDHNRHTQTYTKRDVGQLKATVLKNWVFSIMGITIQTETHKLEASNINKLVPKVGIVIDSFDNSESRQLVRNHCVSNSIDCLHIGLSKDYAEIVWNEFYKVPKAAGIDVCEYPLARNIAMMAIVVATEVLIYYLNTGIKKGFDITLDDLRIVERG